MGKKVSDNPLVYIVMPCYNGETYLLEQLMSIYYQNYTNWYLIFVNDGSKDNSENILRDWISHYSLHKKVKIITKENGGVNSAIQRGLEEIKNLCNIYDSDNLISYCDCDDIWTRDKLEIQVKYMVDNPKCDLSYHDTAWINENGGLIKISNFKGIYRKVSPFFVSVIRGPLISTQMIFKVKTIDDIIPMPLGFGMYQDHRTTLVFSVLNYNIEFIDKSLAYYRRGHLSLMKIHHSPQKQRDCMIARIKYLKEIENKYPDKDFSYELGFLNDLLHKRLDKKWGVIPFWIYVFFKYTKVFFLVLKQTFYENILHRHKKIKS